LGGPDNFLVRVAQPQEARTTPAPALDPGLADLSSLRDPDRQVVRATPNPSPFPEIGKSIPARIHPLSRPRIVRMFETVAYFYIGMKFVYFFSLVRILIKFEPMQKYALFLGVVYTSGVAFLFYTLMLSWAQFRWPPWQYQIAQAVGVSPFLCWIGETVLVSTLYFRLLVRFDEGVMFWTLLLLGVPLVYYS
jgi:hypothetical protein